MAETITGFRQNLVYYSIYWTWWRFQKRYRSILDDKDKRVRNSKYYGNVLEKKSSISLFDFWCFSSAS